MNPKDSGRKPTIYGPDGKPILGPKVTTQLGRRGQELRIQFSRPVLYISFTPEQALLMSTRLKAMAEDAIAERDTTKEKE